MGALLEESSSSAPPSPLLDSDDLVPIPTLASLLLSTAESLSLASKTSANGAFTPNKQPKPFVLPASPSTLLSSPTSAEYLSTLLSLPLPTLQSLPTSLATLSTSLDTDLSSLAFTRYSSFLLSHAAAQAISTSFSTLSTELSSLLDSTSALDEAASEFETRIHQVRAKRERMARVRERMEEVEELLEAPAVVDACVRAGYWSEAIDVAVRLGDLHTRLAGTAAREGSEGKGALVLLDRVREEVSLALLSLRARVLESLLQRGLKLPGAVRGVGILRRMSDGGLGLEEQGADGKELHEEALRIVFLAARWRCLRGELDTVEGQMVASGIKFDPEASSGLAKGGLGSGQDDGTTGTEENEERTRWTKRWIEVWREVVGETVGMYTEVFLSSTAPSSLSSLSPTSPLTLFLSSSLASLSTALSAALPSLTSPSSLSSLLTQLSYCSHSFARHGLEFREIAQVRERVEARVGEIVTHEWDFAGRRWEKEWREGWQGSSRRSRSRERQPLSTWLVVPEGLSSVLSTPLPSSSEEWNHQPPAPLSLLPPLARFVNAHAMALNALRLLPAISLYPSLRLAHSKSLDRASQVLAAFIEAWLPESDAQIAAVASGEGESVGEERRRREERELVGWTVAAFARWVVPWCEGALEEGVYGELGSREREELLEDTVRRCEGLVARVEGREEEVVEEEVAPEVTPEVVPEEEEVLEEESEVAVVDEVMEPELETELGKVDEVVDEMVEEEEEETKLPAGKGLATET